MLRVRLKCTTDKSQVGGFETKRVFFYVIDMMTPASKKKKKKKGKKIKEAMGYRNTSPLQP